MNAHELYDKMAEIRDEYWEKYRNLACDKCNDVFVQMLTAAFTNKYERNQLPEVFNIYEVNFGTEDLKELMMLVGLKVDIDLIKNDYVRGNSFEVRQIF